MKSVSIVTIKSLQKIYKNGEEASSIELANVNEHGYEIVVQKNLYQPGSKAIYVQPDYCLPLPSENPTPAQKMFMDFTNPFGDPKKSKLGANGRIRAVKFNFSTSPDSIDPIYSMGIMMPLEEVEQHLNQTLSNDQELDQLLEITKYEEPEKASSGLVKGDLPTGMYKTDETTIENQIERLSSLLPCEITGSVKVDGSSETIYYKNQEENGICSRSLEKKLEQKMVVGYVFGEDSLRKHFDVETKQKGWFSEKTQTFYTKPPEGYEEVWQDVEDSFVKLGLPYLEKLKQYCEKNNKQISLRGELCGTGLKGSGNKNNPHAKLKQQILFYGADDFSSGATRRMPLPDFYKLCQELELNYCDIVFTKTFNTVQEIIDECNNYFKTNMVEGIVVRNQSCSFSAKVMNREYDSKK